MKNRIIRVEDVQEDMVETLLNGHEKGSTTYIPEIDEIWTHRRGELNLWTGLSNQGKGTMLRFLLLIKCLEESIKSCFYAPEDSPAQWFYNELIHTLSGRSTDKDHPNFIGPDLYAKCLEIIKPLFTFIHIPVPNNTVEAIVTVWRELKESDNSYKYFVIDPHVRVSRSNKADNRDDLQAAYFMGILNDFLRDYPDCIVHVVLHQQTPKKNESGNYDKPSGYQVKQGGSFFDTTDNLLLIYRPNYGKDKRDTHCVIESEKIRRQKLVGLPGKCDFRFNPKTNRYVDYNNPAIDIYDFSKHLK